jgi:PAS domain S-box-containing protein
MLNLLTGISNANSVLMKDVDIESILQKVVEELGAATQIDRCYIFTNRIDIDGALKLYYTQEWCKEGVEIQLGNPDLSGIGYDVLPGLYDSLSNQLPFYGLVKDSKNQLFIDIMQSQDILAYLFTPIFCEGEFWGWIGYDDCTQERFWKQEEVEALYAVAKNIGIRLFREKSELRFQQAQNRFNLTVLGSQQGMWEKDFTTDSLEYSKSFMEMIGYEHHEFEHSYANWKSRIHPNDIDNVEAHLKAYLKKEVSNYTNEFRLKHKNGNYIWIRGSGAAQWDADGNPLYMAGSHLDISKLKMQQYALEEQRNEFDYLINNLAEVVFRLNSEYEFTFLNEFWEPISGYSKVDSLNKKIFSYLDSNDVELLTQNFNALKNSFIDTLTVDVRLIQITGLVRWVQIIATKFRSTSSGNSAIAGSIIDIHNRKEAEGKEKELTEMKSNFVAMASHQFRTPLTIIYTNMELMESYATKLDLSISNKITSLSTRIKGEIDRISDLMNNILLFGRYNANELVLNSKLIVLSSLVKQVTNTYFDNQPDGRHLVIKGNEVKKMVNLDEVLFTYILTNILSNAFKYSVGAQNPELEINFKKTEVELTIKDFGIGIPEEDKSKLFSSFYRASNTATIQGSGLGLIVAKQFIELHKGKIEIYSKLNKGTVVTLILPI